MKVNTELFEKAPIPRAVMKMALPTVLSMLAIVVYNMTDTFFVGQTGDSYQVAAVSLCNPVFMIMMSFASLFGVGGGSAISRSMGANKLKRAANISAFCFYTVLVGSIAVGLLFYFAMPFVLRVMGASENTYGFARDYLMWTCIGTLSITFSNSFPNIIRSEGASMHATIGMLIGIGTNIVLDPVFITTLGMGVGGAALATVIGNCLTCIYFLIYLIVKRETTILSFKPSDFMVGDGIAKEVISVGLPSACNNVLQSSAYILFNNFIAGYGDQCVAAMGVAMRSSTLVVMTQAGVSTGMQPLVAYSYGAKNMKRLKETVRFSIIFTLIIGFSLSLLYLIFTPQIVRLFIDDPVVIEYGVLILRIMLISTPVLGFMFCFMSALQGMGRAVSSFIVSVCRQGLAFIPCIFILNALFEFNGLISSEVIADYITIIISSLMFVKVYKREKKKMESSGAITE